MKDTRKAVTKRLRIILAIAAAAIAITYVAREAGHLNRPASTADQVRAVKDGGAVTAIDTASAAQEGFFVGDNVTIGHPLRINVEGVRVGTNTASEIFHDDSKVLSHLRPGLQTTSVTAFEVSKESFDSHTWRLQIGGGLDRMTDRRTPSHSKWSNAPPAAPAPANDTDATSTAGANTSDTISLDNPASAANATH
jgi:hypothetical protein